MPKCVECSGRKEIPCTRCRAPASREVGRQSKSCECCKRNGKMECPACAGTGKAGPGRGAAAHCSVPRFAIPQSRWARFQRGDERGQPLFYRSATHSSMLDAIFSTQHDRTLS